MKKGLIMVLTTVFTLALSITAFAGEWKQDAKGWWWDNGDGTYPKNAWQWCDGNGDGVSECYYFDGNGYCLMNTTTPDGYLVDANGAWVVDGKVQTQGTVSKAAQVFNYDNLSDAECAKETVFSLMTKLKYPSTWKFINAWKLIPNDGKGRIIVIEYTAMNDIGLRPHGYFAQPFINGKVSFGSKYTGSIFSSAYSSREQIPREAILAAVNQ